MATFVGIVVDNLEHRDDGRYSGRIGCYDCTEDEVAMLLEFIRRHESHLAEASGCDMAIIIPSHPGATAAV